jgi:predicted regulator of Ras-like GTPase activity (Roadblock/LC7/MglB family)
MISVVTLQQSEQLGQILLNLITRAEAEAAFLCDRGGNILARQATQVYEQEDNIAALASGAFFATRVLAGLLGETEFHHVIHQGATRSIFMQTMNCDLLLLVVFSRESNPGLVRLYGHETCQEIDRFVAAQQPADTGGAAFEMDESKAPFLRVKR